MGHAVIRKLMLIQEFHPNAGDSEPMFVFDRIYGPMVSVRERDGLGPTLTIYRVQD